LVCQVCIDRQTAKIAKPHAAKKIRLISGRNSPSYSYGITDSLKDPQATGNAVLGMWNEHINIAKAKFEPLRTSVLVRNMNTLEFTLFENLKMM